MAFPKKAKYVSIALLLGVATIALFLLNRTESSASLQSTDDAYVQADFTTVAPRISGLIEKVLIEDNQQVSQGQLIASFDDRDFRVAVNAEKAQVASARASINSLRAHLTQQAEAIRQAQATVAGEDAAVALAAANRKRYRNLANDGSGTVQAREQAEAQWQIQLASRDRSRAGLASARLQVSILQADLERAGALLAQAQSEQAAAELKLSYTRITAPISGTIGRKAVRIGAFVNAGQPLLAIVPLEDVYVTANYRETQLAHVQPGQAVEIEIDALPGTKLKGTVDSLGPASGASYSTIAPHNATGNFTKIVQRLPVRIRINPDQPEAFRLRVGMSVTSRIRTEH